MNITLDCLYDSDLKICGEIEISIQHNLLAKDLALPKTDLEIHAHEQTLSQCKNWLDDYCPNIKRVAVSSNAQAALNSSKSDSVIAIAGRAAIEKYNLKVIAEKIQDSKNNTTRFITVSKNDVEASGSDKTSVFITTKNEPGALFNALKPFHEKKINYMDALIGDKNILKSLTEKEIKDIFVPEKHLGASQIIINNVDKHVKVNAKKLSKL